MADNKKDTAYFTMADDNNDNYDEYEEEVVNNEEYYDEENPEEYDEENPDGEYYDEENPEEEYYDDAPAEGEEGYDDGYYDDRLEQVLDELAELKKGMGGQNNSSPNVPYLFTNNTQPATQNSNNDAVMYNELSRLRDELSKTQNNQALQQEISRLKEDMVKEKRYSETQLLDEIKRLQGKVESLEVGATGNQPLLSRANNKGANRIDSVSKEEFTKLVTATESLAKNGGDKKLYDEVASIKTQLTKIPSLDELNKVLVQFRKNARSPLNEEAMSKLNTELSKLRIALVESGMNVDATESYGIQDVLKGIDTLKSSMSSLSSADIFRALMELRLQIGVGDEAQENKIKQEIESLEKMTQFDDKLALAKNNAERFDNILSFTDYGKKIKSNTILSKVSYIIKDLTDNSATKEIIESFSTACKQYRIPLITPEIAKEAIDYLDFTSHFNGTNTGDYVDFCGSVLEKKNALLGAGYEAINDAQNEEIINLSTDIMFADNDEQKDILQKELKAKAQNFADITLYNLLDLSSLTCESVKTSYEITSLTTKISELKDSLQLLGSLISNRASDDASNNDISEIRGQLSNLPNIEEFNSAINSLDDKIALIKDEILSAKNAENNVVEEPLSSAIDDNLAMQLEDLSAKLDVISQDVLMLSTLDQKADPDTSKFDILDEKVDNVNSKIDFIDQKIDSLDKLDVLQDSITDIGEKSMLLADINATVTDLIAKVDAISAIVTPKEEETATNDFTNNDLSTQIYDARDTFLDIGENITNRLTFLDNLAESLETIKKETGDEGNIIAQILSLKDDILLLSSSLDLPTELEKINDNVTKNIELSGENILNKIEETQSLESILQIVEQLNEMKAESRQDCEQILEDLTALKEYMMIPSDNELETKSYEDVAYIREGLDQSFANSETDKQEIISSIDTIKTSISEITSLQNISFEDLSGKVTLLNDAVIALSATDDSENAEQIGVQLGELKEQIDSFIAISSDSSSLLSNDIVNIKSQLDKISLDNEETKQAIIEKIYDIIPPSTTDENAIGEENSVKIYRDLSLVKDKLDKSDEIFAQTKQEILDKIALVNDAIDILTATQTPQDEEVNALMEEKLNALDDINSKLDLSIQSQSENRESILTEIRNINDALLAITANDNNGENSEVMTGINTKLDLSIQSQSENSEVITDISTKLDLSIQSQSENRESILSEINNLNDALLAITANDNDGENLEVITDINSKLDLSMQSQDENKEELLSEIRGINDNLLAISANSNDEDFLDIKQSLQDLTALVSETENKQETVKQEILDEISILRDSLVTLTVDTDNNNDDDMLKVLQDESSLDRQHVLDAVKKLSVDIKDYMTASQTDIQNLTDTVAIISDKMDATATKTRADTDSKVESSEVEENFENIRISIEEMQAFNAENNKVLFELVDGISKDLDTAKNDIMQSQQNSFENSKILAEDKELASADDINQLLNEIVSLREEIAGIKEDIAKSSEIPAEEENKNIESLNMIVDEVSNIKVSIKENLEEQDKISNDRIVDLSSEISELKDMVSRRVTIASDDNRQTSDSVQEIEIVLSEIADLKKNIDDISENITDYFKQDEENDKKNSTTKNDILEALQDMKKTLNASDNFDVEGELSEIKSQLNDIILATNLASDGNIDYRELKKDIDDIKEILQDELVEKEDSKGKLNYISEFLSAGGINAASGIVGGKAHRDDEADLYGEILELKNILFDVQSDLNRENSKEHNSDADMQTEIADLKEQIVSLNANLASLKNADTSSDNLAIMNEFVSLREDLSSLKDNIVVSMPTEQTQTIDTTNNFEELHAEIDSLKQLILATQNQNSQADMSSDSLAIMNEFVSLREDLSVLKDNIIAVNPIPVDSAPDMTVLTEVMSLREEITALKGELQNIKTTTEPVMEDATVLTEIFSLRDEINSLKEFVSRPAKAIETEPDLSVVTEILSLREEIEAFKKSIDANYHGANITTDSKIAENLERLQQEIREKNDTQVFDVSSEILSLRQDFDTLSGKIDTLQKSEKEIDLTGIDNRMNGVADEIKNLREQFFSVSMANVDLGGKSSYESYNNIILDEIGAIRDSIENPNKLEQKANADELIKTVTNELNQLKEELANQREADLTTLNFMSEMAHLLERQNQYISQSSNNKLANEFESLKAEIAASSAPANDNSELLVEINKLKKEIEHNATTDGVDNQTFLVELAKLKDEFAKEKDSSGNDLIISEISKLKDEIGSIVENSLKEQSKVVKDKTNISQSINDLKSELTQIADMVSTDNAVVSPKSEAKLAPKKKTVTKAKPDSDAKTSGTEAVVPGINFVMNDVEDVKPKKKTTSKPKDTSKENTENALLDKINDISNDLISNDEYLGSNNLSNSNSDTELDIASKLAQQVANKLILEQLVQQLGDGGVPNNKVDEIIKDIMPQEFNTVQIEEQSDQVRRLANSLVLDKLRARLKNRKN